VGFEPTISAGERPQIYALDWDRRPNPESLLKLAMERAKFKFLLFVVYLFNMWSVAQATQCRIIRGMVNTELGVM
jgi:hypothetical protein